MTKSEIKKKFRAALANGSVYARYQPQFNHATGRMVGAEALMRWRDDEYGEQSPADFIPVLEETGLMHEADLYMFRVVCDFIRRRLDAGDPVVPISFNVSRHDVYGHDYVRELEAIRKEYDVPVNLLRAEITESSAIGGTEFIEGVLNEFHDCGYVVEMDDFGSGYSSLNVLKDLPVDVIKLDLRFLSGNTNGRGGVIISSVARLSRWLNTPLIAEGVETSRQADFMKSVGCNYVQGYLYSKPINEDEFVRLLRATEFEAVAIASGGGVADMAKLFDPDSPESMFFGKYVGPALILAMENDSFEIVQANDKFFAELGICGRATEQASRLFSDDNAPRFVAAANKSVDSGREETCDVEITVDSGACGIVNACVRCLLYPIGNVGSVVVFYVNVKNVTEEIAKEREIEASETKFRYASEHVGSYAWEYDVATKEARPCSRCKRDLGMPDVVENYPEPLLGNLFPADYADAYRDWMRRISEGEKSLSGIIPLTENRIPFKIEYTTVFDEAGRPYKAYGSATPVETVEKDDSASGVARALAGAHMCVYVVDSDDGSFSTFASSPKVAPYDDGATSGDDFFDYFGTILRRNMFEDELETFDAEFRMDEVRREMSETGEFRRIYGFDSVEGIKYAAVVARYCDDLRKKFVVVADDVTEAFERMSERDEARSESRMYSDVVRRLADDYSQLCLVDLASEEFVEYVHGEGGGIVVRKGDRFFSECSKKAPLAIHPDDFDDFFGEFGKEQLKGVVVSGKSKTINYRLLVDDEWSYVCMRVVGLDDGRVVIGVRDVGEQMEYREKARKLEEERSVCARMFALVGNLMCVYVVESDLSYVEYGASDDYETLGIPKTGGDFFYDAARSVERLAHPDDVRFAMLQLRENVVRDRIEADGFFQLNYRLMLGQEARHVSVRIVPVFDSDGNHLVVGVSDVSSYVVSQKKRGDSSNGGGSVDRLTHVKNKRAYADLEDSMNRSIAGDGRVEFGLFVFDVDGSRMVNEKQGRVAGNEWIKSACSDMCRIFKRSPVYRVGGDEFVVVLKGADYESIESLVLEVDAANVANAVAGKATVSYGLAAYDSEADSYVSDVWSRAESTLLEMKERRRAERAE